LLSCSACPVACPVPPVLFCLSCLPILLCLRGRDGGEETEGKRLRGRDRGVDRGEETEGMYSCCPVLPVLSACPVPPVLFCLSCLPILLCLSCFACLVSLSNYDCPVLPVLFCLSILFCLSCLARHVPGCHVLALLLRQFVLPVPFLLSCSGCPVLAVLFWLSCSACPVLGVLSWAYVDART
jgi:hypothetical protein